MTSPIKLHIVPNCGIQIIPKLSEDEDVRASIRRRTSLDFHAAGGVNGKRALSYTIEDIDAQGFPVAINEHCSLRGNEQKDFSGVMSPLSPLSLPKQRKKQAGIDARATRYAYIHPPRGLAAALDWGQIRVVWKQLKYHEKKVNESIHCDDEDSLFSTDNLTASRSMQSLSSHKSMTRRFIKRKNSSEISQPLIVPPSSSVLKKWALACFSLLGAFVYFEDRDDGVEVISVNALCLSKLGTQGGIRMSGPYKTPLETVQVLKSLGRFEVIPLENFHECGFVAKAWLCPKEQGSSHGSLVFLKEDNTAVTYNVKSGADALRSGSISILADLMDPHDLDFKMIMGQNFVTNFVACNDDENCRQRFLQHFPSWSSLHYSCRFNANELELIQQLKEECYDSIGKLDRFNRSIMHLACGSLNVKEEVVRELLDNDDNNVVKRLLYSKTKCCKNLPLHVAIASGAPKEVIEVLLNAAKKKQTYLEKTADGRLPLHIAIEKMADKSVIELLLKVDTERQSIYTEFKGMLPLHIACWNGHHDAVEVLLEYDEEGRSLHHNASISTYLKFKSKKDYLTFNSNYEAVVVSPKKPSSSKRLHGSHHQDEIPWVRALHIALLKCSDENSSKITKLLLRGEYWNIHSEEGEVTVTMTDSAGRNPLMLACMQNADDEIIRSLIDLDLTKNTAAQIDNTGNTALHHACEHKLVSDSVVQILLDAEDEHYSRFRPLRPLLTLSIKQKLRSCVGLFKADVYQPPPIEKSTNKLNNQRMTPLKLAIRSGASTSVLKMLLEGDRIDMREFDDQTIHQLSLRVKESKTLQESINHKLSARHPCFNLLMSLIWKVAIFTIFAIETNGFLREHASVWPIGITILCIYLSIEIFKELHEFAALGVSYLLSRKNWVDFSRIALMIVSVHFFVTKMTLGNHESYVLMASTFLLGLDIVIAFRSTFLPFAKFAGGLLAILTTLIPFFIVSIVFLICFAIAFRIQAVLDGSENDPEQKICGESLWLCVKMVVKAFLTGEFESNHTLYLAFGFVVILILLTIVIAIVSDAWDAVENRATEYYWESRITFLHDIQSPLLQSKKPSYVRQLMTEFASKVAACIDNFGYVDLFDEEEKFSWTRDSPYNQVSDIEQYYKPYDYFHPSVAKVIKQAHSPRSDLYWISHKQEGLQRRKSIILAGVKWTFYISAYFTLILLGCVTGGFFWPTGFRRFILSYGYNSTNAPQKGREEKKSSSTKDERNEVMPTKSNNQKFEDFFIDIMGVSSEIAQEIDTKSKIKLICDKLGVKIKHDCQGGCK